MNQRERKRDVQERYCLLVKRTPKASQAFASLPGAHFSWCPPSHLSLVHPLGAGPLPFVLTDLTRLFPSCLHLILFISSYFTHTVCFNMPVYTNSPHRLGTSMEQPGHSPTHMFPDRGSQTAWLVAVHWHLLRMHAPSAQSAPFLGSPSRQTLCSTYLHTKAGILPRLA